MREELSPLTPREACKVATPQEVVSKPTIPKEASKAATPRDTTNVQGGLPEPPEVSKVLTRLCCTSPYPVHAVHPSSPISQLLALPRHLLASVLPLASPATRSLPSAPAIYSSSPVS
ncbi:uncharacterized protein B0H18DRAFT_1128796 [Fomitopsis serialis]|uniref:uncharacterized protein n=1 Tax=Fomitopsis serialis TaxID=139415 RepID=UPI0020073AC2|nr:uncharacterized protein B0H18DRAFT_1128796 [Neoantrodia serialis]KAH9911379.1 hypothetical protein B0H18DRAFT_1128796 [Neoantrodia serialis]